MPQPQDLIYLQENGEARQIAPGIRYYRCRLPDGEGRVWTAHPYEGVSLIAGDFRVPQFALPYLEHYSLLKLNYCTGGRCEVPLANGRYTYLESGELEVDLNQSLGALALPTGFYQGMELVLDLDCLAARYPAAWQECGVCLQQGVQQLAARGGSIRLHPTDQWDALARGLAARLQQGSLAMADARFTVLQLLYLLQNDGGMGEITGGSFLTRGQRTLVAQAEQRLTADLAARHPIEQVAAELGISASALKKYFGQVYGKPISAYLREKRMERAKQLLATTGKSVAAVAMEVGYQNQGKFGAVFSGATGATPSEYRRLCRAGYFEKGVDEE